MTAPESIAIPLGPVLTYLVVLSRVGGLCTFAPFWGNRAAPVRVRVVVALVVSLAVYPAVLNHIETPPSDLFKVALIMMGEVLIGFTIGFVGRVVFMALEVAAHAISTQIGFTLAAIIDPATKAQTGAFATIAQMLALVILLAMDGHHWFLATTVESFSEVRPGEFVMTAALAELFVRLSADALMVGVALAAPALVVLFAVEVAVAVAGRAAPQLQVMLLSFPIKIAAGLVVLGATIYSMPGAIRSTLGVIREALSRAVATM